MSLLIHYKALWVRFPTCILPGPLIPGDWLAGDQSLHMPVPPPLPPTSFHRPTPHRPVGHPVPQPCLCVCASSVCRMWCPPARGTLWTCPRTQRASCRSRRSGLKSPAPWRPRPPAGAACCPVRGAGPRSAREMADHVGKEAGCCQGSGLERNREWAGGAFTGHQVPCWAQGAQRPELLRGRSAEL